MAISPRREWKSCGFRCMCFVRYTIFSVRIATCMREDPESVSTSRHLDCAACTASLFRYACRRCCHVTSRQIKKGVSCLCDVAVTSSKAYLITCQNLSICYFLIVSRCNTCRPTGMYVCMVITCSRVWINRVRSPILLVVS